jgi:hypothetical protein
MHHAIEAIIQPAGGIRPLERIRLYHRVPALLTILEDKAEQSGTSGAHP